MSTELAPERRVARQPRPLVTRRSVRFSLTRTMCLSACIKADILRIQYGAPHEPGIDPDLSAARVAESSLRPVVLIGDILAAECAAQIRQARQASTHPRAE
jgi:hypothetical protein